eukprot:COSAG02_NODE_22752_length_741_cov_1.037383_1_plen_132_part_10
MNFLVKTPNYGQTSGGCGSEKSLFGLWRLPRTFWAPQFSILIYIQSRLGGKVLSGFTIFSVFSVFSVLRSAENLPGRTPKGGAVLIAALPNCADCARLGVSTFHWFLSAGNLSLNFFGTDCAQVFNFWSCPN